MQCPYCGGDASVLDSRNNAEGVRRRRSCGDCKRRFTTYEKIAAPAIRVHKRTGKSEAFDSDKIVQILQRVGRDRPHFEDQEPTRIARSVEAKLLDDGVKTISSGDIANLLLDILKDIDRLVYDRLAANYLNDAGVLKTSMTRESSDSDTQLGLFQKEKSQSKE